MKYLMVLQHGAMDEFLYRDILKKENVHEFQVSAPDCNRLLYKIRRIHTSTIATKYFDPPFKTIWYKNALLKATDNDTCLVFQMAAMIHVGSKTLEAVRKRRPGAKLVLLLIDSVDAHSLSMKYAKRFIFGFKWDLILSFDKGDCEKYGFTYMGYSYYSKLDVNDDEPVDSDLYYIGAVKNEEDRMQLLTKIYDKGTAEDVVCNFTLLTQKETAPHGDIKLIDKGIPYSEVVKELNKANCILELIQEGQNNQTARYMEAVCYNKKLLTNNKRVVDLPYYDDRYIRVFADPDDIDFNWVKAREKVDFDYKDDFSPARILDLIERELY